MTAEGLTTLPSSFGPQETMNRVAAAVTELGMSILARIDHAEAAAKAGLALLPTEVLIFGNPQAGTPLMQITQSIGIDLPLKTLVWQDHEGRTWLAYNDPRWLARRHGAGPETSRVVEAMVAALATVAKRATTQSPTESK